MTNNTLLSFHIAADWDGKRLIDNGPIGLQAIQFNGFRWDAHGPLGSLILIDGGTLVIRREGRCITIERPPTRKKK